MKDIVKVKVWRSPEAATQDGDVLELAEPIPAATTATAPAGRLADPPSIALVEHRSSSGCQWNRPLAFVGAVSVGEETTLPCSVSVFSQGNGMLFPVALFNDQKWLQKGARFNLSRVPPISLNITIFLAPARQAANNPADDLGSNLEALAQNDVAQAEMILSTNRTGLTIKATYEPLSSSDDLAIRIGADPYDCVLTPQLPADPGEDDYAYNPSTVSVYYVERINYPLDPVQPRVRGIQCHHWYSGNPQVGSPPGRGPVVFISYSHHSPVTLAHELGHALGLNDDIGELGNRDVMHNLLPDGPLGADARSHLTIGQVFRMNVWNDSWINTRLPKPIQRACDVGEHCPEIRWNPDAH